jgi:hypothetical protein
MSVLSLKRVILFVAATLIAAPLFAAHPSPRVYSRMAYDEQAGVGVLFGGREVIDTATGLMHASDETWFWVGNRWMQQFPENHPEARSSHGMTYDSTRGRIVLFGGRKESTELRGLQSHLDDTWVFQNGNWQKIETPHAPSPREFVSLAYDRARDRVILYGGYHLDAEEELVALHDTWEFDGNDWMRVGTEDLEVSNAILLYDIARNRTIMLAVEDDLDPVMFGWNHEEEKWDSITPTDIPPCVSEGGMAFQNHNGRIAFAGGVCLAEPQIQDEVWEWDGENWTVVDTNFATRTTGSAMLYDPVIQRVVRFSGNDLFATNPQTDVALYHSQSKNIGEDKKIFGRWRYSQTSATPSPRSLLVLRRDPSRDVMWLFGGLHELSTPSAIFYNDDLWRFRNGQWNRISATGAPVQCITPLAAFDTDREKLVVVCSGSAVFEWDGVEWKAFADVEPLPGDRRFAGFVYDQNIKKCVLFGGYDGRDYKNETWTWDGTKWTKVDANKKPPNRAQMAMWYDPLAHKTILYSGVGRPNINERSTRFEDMWSFDGSTWTEMTVTPTPGIRFGSQVAVNPNDGTVVLFGGLRSTSNDERTLIQYYGNDTWVWDGAANRWTEMHPAASPTPRQNFGFDFDPVSGKFMLYGGFAGNFYFSDVWLWDGGDWTPQPETGSPTRRRPTR